MFLHLRKVLIALNIILILSVIIMLFYGSPLRLELEGRLADIKTRVLPLGKNSEDVVVVAIDEAAIKTLSGQQAKDLDYPGMQRLTEAVLGQGPRAVVALLHTQVFPYDSPERAPFMRLAFDHPNLFIGVFDLKKSLAVAGDEERRQERAFSARLVQGQWEEVISDVPAYRPPVLGQLEFLVPAVAAYLAPGQIAARQSEFIQSGSTWTPERADTKAIKLNYFPLGRLKKITAQDFMTRPEAAELKGKVVVIGYGVFRPNKFRVAEATFLNTPWQNPGDSLSRAVPVSDILATALDNIISDTWLRKAPPWINVLQSATISALALAIWSTSISLAVLFYGAGFVALMLFQAYARSLWNIEIPIADSLFFATMMTFVGGFWRLRQEIHARAVDEASATSERELAKTQERFLNRFSFELSRANEDIANHLTKAGLLLPPNQPQLADIHARALEGSRELEDYLSGIRDLAHALDKKWEKVKLGPVNVLLSAEKVVRRLDAKLQERQQKVTLSGAANLSAHSDVVLVEQILHNLLSNASKYSPQGSSVVIDITGNAHEVVVSVKDQGPGIAPEHRDKIFEKFYRIPNDQVYKVRGTGVGLFLSRYFATMIGADILVESELGSGSTFSLRLRRGRWR